MKRFILTLSCLISAVSAGVLDSPGRQSEGSVDRNKNNIRSIGTQRLSQMTHEDLVHQKFLLDILQHVNEPINNDEELPQISEFQLEQLAGDQQLYDGGIDNQMANVIEMSRSQELLSKEEVFNIANDEHMHQMVGLYRLFVRSRDWNTLQRNILHARIHVNGVLLVNSLLLAIRDRDDSQNLLIPGIHEILPELYLNESVVQGTGDIDLNQWTNSRPNIETDHTSILEMIGRNKLLNRKTHRVGSMMDWKQLWMPWHEMRMQIQAQKVGGVNVPKRIWIRDDDRIVLPVIPPINLVSKEREIRLLTEDVGFQSFLHFFINDLCINENEVMEQNRQQPAMGLNNANLARIGLERNVGSMLENEIRHHNDEVNDESMRNTDTVISNTSKDQVLNIGSRRWSKTNADINTLGSANSAKGVMNHEQVTDNQSSNPRWQQQVSSLSGDIRDRFVGAQHPTMVIDDVNERQVFNTNMNRKNEGKVSLDMDVGMGMPMDWNRQMAMHRQRVNHVQKNKLDKNLPEIDINDERLLHVSRRRLNQLKWSMEQKERQQQTEVDERGSPRVNTQWLPLDKLSGNGLSAIRYKVIDAAIRNERHVENPRIWAKVARGMGNIGIHVGPQFRKQSGSKSDEKDGGAVNNGRRPIIHWDNDRDLSTRNAEIRTGTDMSRQRTRRSIKIGEVVNRQRNVEQVRGGELLLHNLQQLIARINLEQTSLGLNDALPSRFNTQRLTNAADERFALRLNDMRQNNRRQRIFLDRINEVEKRLNLIIELEIARTIESKRVTAVRNNGDIDRIIGNALMGKGVLGKDVSILNVLREINSQTEDINGDIQKITLVTMNIRDPIVLHLLRRIVRMADLQRQQALGSYRKEEIEMSGVAINDVEVGRLRTYVDTTDVDLINALDAKHTLTSNQGPANSQRMLVTRQQRLNHQTFTINVDVTSDRNQRVVVRTLLGPKTGVNGLGLNDQRQNFILLDTQVVDLHNGHNQITRKSGDINWTSRDTTPFTEVYKRVLQALNGQMNIISDQLQGQTCRFPHRLLLPRGRVNGLPMQMLTVITPVENGAPTRQALEMSNRICGFGMSNLNTDRQPLGFPLDRPLQDMQQITLLPNVHLMDVQIYHDNQLKTP